MEEIESEKDSSDEHKEQTESSKLVNFKEKNYPKVHSRSDKQLTPAEVLNILENVNIDDLNTHPPIMAQGGEIYIFTSKDRDDHIDDWKCDSYKWHNNGQKKLQTKNNGSLKKVYYKIIREDNKPSFSFTKQAYYKVDNPHLVLVHYMGNEKSFQPCPHGNTKSSQNGYMRTCPSVIKAIKKTEGESAGNLYKKLVTNGATGPQQGICNPRNLRQIKNLQNRVRNCKRLSHDDYYNVLELAFNLDSFIHHIKIYPDFICILGLKALFDEFDKVTQNVLNVAVICGYDTTFQLGDFYISTLSFRHTLFEGNPVTPLAFVIHDRKFQNVHETFLSVLKSLIPNISSENIKIVVIVDREKGISNAITKVLPNVNIVYCWNHIKQDIKFWLRKHGASSDDITVYINQVIELMKSENEEKFDELADLIQNKWSIPFLDYFTNYLKNDLVRCSARWILEQLDIYDKYSGITNNAAEAFNTVLKRLQEWKEVPADKIILSIFLLQNFYFLEIQRGFAGLGDLKLKNEYFATSITTDQIQKPTLVCHPDEVVQLIKGDSISIIQPKISLKSAHACQFEKKESDHGADYQKVSSTKTNDHSSQNALAKLVVSSGSIKHVPEMQSFIVEGNGEKKYCVTLHPKETCSCPSTRSCYHILAARMSIGLNFNSKKKTYNLTQLKRNARKKCDKRSGRKKPQAGDCDMSMSLIEPAPDSIYLSDLTIDNMSFGKALATNFISTPKTDIPKRKDKDKKRKKLKFEDEYLEHDVDSKATINSDGLISSKNPNIDSHEVFFGEEAHPSDFLEVEINDVPESSKIKEIHHKDFDTSNQIELDVSVKVSPIREDENAKIEVTEMKPNTTKKIKRMWNEKLTLTFKDKHEIIHDKCLSSSHMNAVMQLLKAQFPRVGSLQITEKSPVFIKSENRWSSVFPFNPTSDQKIAQIHHTGNHHWVVSLKDCDNQQIYVLDSMFENVTTSLMIQLTQVYKSQFIDQNHIPVKLPSVQRQPNVYDCGVFAIAFITEFCNKNLLSAISANFNVNLMRKHLVWCLDNGLMTDFPKNKIYIPHPKVSERTFVISISCKCQRPDVIEDMIGCSNDKCKNPWYHYSCTKEKSVSNINASVDWFCANCR